jgi:hypothetical protein
VTCKRSGEIVPAAATSGGVAVAVVLLSIPESTAAVCAGLQVRRDAFSITRRNVYLVVLL